MLSVFAQTKKQNQCECISSVHGGEGTTPIKHTNIEIDNPFIKIVYRQTILGYV